MIYCLKCNAQVNNVLKHIEKYHKPRPEENNKGDFYCPLCKVKVNNRSKHYYAKLHRWNIENNAVELQYFSEDFIKHYEKEYEQKERDNIDKNPEHYFWNTAKLELSVQDYKKLKEYVYGRKRRKRIIRRRNTKRRRPSRLTKRFKTNC